MELAKDKRGYFLYRLFCPKENLCFQHLCFISMYNVLNTLSEYTYFYISTNITSNTFLACFWNRRLLNQLLKSSQTCFALLYRLHLQRCYVGFLISFPYILFLGFLMPLIYKLAKCNISIVQLTIPIILWHSYCLVSFVVELLWTFTLYFLTYCGQGQVEWKGGGCGESVTPPPLF